MYANILVPVDPSGGPVGRRIVAVARLLAGGRGRITLLTVVPSLPGHVRPHISDEVIAAGHAEARAQLEALAREGGIDPGTVVVREGGPGSVILEEARRLGSDAIVLGAHRPGFGDFLIGSTAARVVRHARCTVVVERSAPVGR